MAFATMRSSLYDEIVSHCSSTMEWTNLINLIIPVVNERLQSYDDFDEKTWKEFFIHLVGEELLDINADGDTASASAAVDSQENASMPLMLLEPYIQHSNSNEIMKLILQRMKDLVVLSMVPAADKKSDDDGNDPIMIEKERLYMKILSICNYCVSTYMRRQDGLIDGLRCIDEALVASIASSDISVDAYLRNKRRKDDDYRDVAAAAGTSSVLVQFYDDDDAIKVIRNELRYHVLPTNVRSRLWLTFLLKNTLPHQQILDKFSIKFNRRSLTSVKKNELTELISTSVKYCLSDVFYMSSALSENHEKYAYMKKDLSKLCRRAELLVESSYSINGVISDRIMHTSLLLMHVFPDETPSSELVIRLLTRIVQDCLPSEQLHKEYNIAATATACWKLLEVADIELFVHLRDVLQMLHSNGDDDDDDAINGKQHHHLPICYLFLRRIIDCCFLGYLNEQCALYVWDRIVLCTGQPHVFQDLMPVILTHILLHIREKLLCWKTSSSSHSAAAAAIDFVNMLKHETRKIRLRDFISIANKIIEQYN